MDSLYAIFLLCVCVMAALALAEIPQMEHIFEVIERERPRPAVQEAAARGVLSRLLPSHSESFKFEIVSKERCGGKSCFIIGNYASSLQQASEILIKGTTGVELSAGLHWYLKHWCGAHISWDKTGGVQLASIPVPGSLPHVQSAGVLVQRPIPWSYYQNAVTSSYSFAWWDWKRWEKEIDWMALQGVNLPLAFNGQEALWQKVFQKLNISSTDLNDFFGGPGFLAWARMANLHRWGGPLPQSWHDQQLILQKKILARMHNLGMTPVLPAFSGNVPAALKTIYPDAKIARLGNWFTVRGDPRWCCTYLLDPTDPLFVQIGKAFIEQQRIEYGKTGHIYNCDTFDENTPPDDDPDYIAALGSAIYEAMLKGDSEAVWLMQGWLFSYDPFWRPPQMKALLHSVPIGRLVILDLFAEVKPIWMTSDQFYGVPYIWCMLHNFAGNIEMYGVLDAVASGPINARQSENSMMKWIYKYPNQRYGKTVKALQDAWNILYHTVYNCTDGKYVRYFWEYDLIDLTRQAVAKHANQIFLKVIAAYQSKDLHGVALYSQLFLDIVNDLDTLLACHEGFLLGPWLESAKELAQNEEQEKQYEWNARTQITMWFDNTEVEASLLRDYGNKYWSGLLQDYYGPRAAIYFSYLLESLETGEDFRLIDWRRDWIALTNKWQNSRKIFPSKGEGDALNIALQLYEKYLQNPVM
ncbi:hypothetical protein AMTRI_Chr10g4990 [Amborella trichopoda]